MLDTQPDSRSDRPDYFGPGCDVASADMIGVGRKTAPGADELRLRAAVRLVDVAALGARSARVARVHCDKGDARKRGLVAEERTQLEERPRMQRRSLSLSNRYPIADAIEVFNGDAAAGVFGLANDRLADDVIRVCVKVALPPSELSEMTFGALGTSGLKSGAELGDAGASGQSGLAGVGCAVRVHGEVANAEVDAKPSIRIDGRTVGYLDGHEQVELALAVHEVGLTANSLKASSMVRADSARHDDAPVEREQADTIETVLERVDALVVGDGAERLEGAELRLVATVDLKDLRDRADGMLGRESKPVTEIAVVQPLELDLVGALSLKSPLGQPRTRLVYAPHRGKQTVPLFGRDEQLDRRNEFHSYSRTPSITKHKETALPLGPVGPSFRAGER